MIKLLLVFLSFSSFVYAGSLQDISINQNEKSSEVVISVKGIESKDIKVIELSNPKRIYFDIENSKKKDFLSFIRRFNDNTSAITELRVWHHAKIANKQNVYRVAFQFDTDLVDNYKVVKKSEEKLHIFFYPKKKVQLNSFAWGSKQISDIRKIAVAESTVKSDPNKIGLISVDYNKFKELSKLKFTFNGKIPEYDYSLKNEKKYLLMKFDSEYKLNNKEISRVFQENAGNIETIKFLGQDESEKAIFSIQFKDEIDPNSIIIEESLNGISLSILDEVKDEVKISFVDLNKIWNKVTKNSSMNLVEKVYAKEALSSTKVAKKIRIIDSSAILRKSPMPYSEKIISLDYGMRFKVLDFKDGYYKVKSGKNRGYVFKSFTDASVYDNKENKRVEILTKSVPEKDVTTEAKKQTTVKSTSPSKFYKVNVDDLNLRSSSSKTSKVKKMLTKNTRVVELKRKGKWSYIELVGNKEDKGWVMTTMIKPDDSMKNVGKKSLVVMNKNITDTLTVIPLDNKISFKRHKELGPFIPRFKENAEEESAPNLAFLSLVGIIYDKYDKIALFESRDKELSKTIFTMREGDKVKSGKLYKIEKDKVVFLMTMFGITKTQILKLENKDK